MKVIASSAALQITDASQTLSQEPSPLNLTPLGSSSPPICQEPTFLQVLLLHSGGPVLLPLDGLRRASHSSLTSFFQRFAPNPSGTIHGLLLDFSPGATPTPSSPAPDLVVIVFEPSPCFLLHSTQEACLSALDLWSPQDLKSV